MNPSELEIQTVEDIKLSSELDTEELANRIQKIIGQRLAPIEKVSLKRSVNLHLSLGTQKVNSPFRTVLLNIIEELESPKKVKEVTKFLDESGVKRYDELFMETLFNVLKPTSKTARLLCSITQNIVFAGVYQIKLLLAPIGILTGDVSGRSGWYVL